MSEIVVYKNAPGWPAMVNRKQIKINTNEKNMISSKSLPVISIAQSANINQKQLQQVKALNEVDSLLLKKRFNKDQNQQSYSDTLTTRSKFASKIVRQCFYCQILYTNFHCCQPT